MNYALSVEVFSVTELRILVGCLGDQCYFHSVHVTSFYCYSDDFLKQKYHLIKAFLEVIKTFFSGLS